jgi:hypothetical protein
MNFECTFEGGDGGKGGGWHQKCHSKGWYTDEQSGLAALEDGGDGEFELYCSDGDDDQGDRPVYDDRAHRYFDPYDHSVTIKGLTEQSPIILIQFNDPSGPGSFAADVNFSRHGYSYDIPGRCRLFRDTTTVKEHPESQKRRNN